MNAPSPMATQPTKSVADVLQRAADLIARPGAWTQGEFARGKTGRPVKTRDCAVCLCVIGAIDVASGARPGTEANDDALRVLAWEVGCSLWDIAVWNDEPERTQEEVVAKLKEAATLAREQGK
jgi:hypothetical protein